MKEESEVAFSGAVGMAARHDSDAAPFVVFRMSSSWIMVWQTLFNNSATTRAALFSWHFDFRSQEINTSPISLAARQPHLISQPEKG